MAKSGRKILCYKELFKTDNPAAKAVLADLEKFCDRDVCKCAGFPIDEKTVFIAIGRRQVLDYIERLANIDDGQLREIIKQEQNNEQYSI